MEQRKDDAPLETSLFRAIQKNKIIQGQSIRQQQLNDFQLAESLKTYHFEQKYNRELLYSWKNETYLRDLKKKLQNSSPKNDKQYEYQLKSLNHMISGQPGIIIPPSEEQRRLNIKTKYEEFLRQNPLRTSVSNTTAHISIDKSPDELARSLEETWKHIHFQSAMWSKQKQNTGLTTLRRSLTLNEMRKKSVRLMEQRKLSLNENSPIRSNHFELYESIEPPPLTLELVGQDAHSDLFTMRSIRRPRQSSAELKSLYEARKHIYQMNRRIINNQTNQKKLLDQCKKMNI